MSATKILNIRYKPSPMSVTLKAINQTKMLNSFGNFKHLSKSQIKETSMGAK